MISNGGPSISAGWDPRRVATPDAFMESAKRQLSGPAKIGAIQDLRVPSSESALKHTTKSIAERNEIPSDLNAQASAGLTGTKDRVDLTQSTMTKPEPAGAIEQKPDAVVTALEVKLENLKALKDLLTAEQYDDIQQQLRDDITAAKSSVTGVANESRSLPPATKPSIVDPAHRETSYDDTSARTPVQDKTAHEGTCVENPRKRKTAAASDFPTAPDWMNTSKSTEAPINVRVSNDKADTVPSAPTPSVKPASKILNKANQPLESVPTFTGGRDNLIGEWVYQSHFVPSMQSRPASTTATASPSTSGAFSPPVTQFRALSLNDPAPVQPKSSSHPTPKASLQKLSKVLDSAVTRQYANADASEDYMQGTSTAAKAGSQRAPSWNVTPYDSTQLSSERAISKGPTLPAFLSNVVAPVDPGKAARMQYLGISNDENSKPMNLSGQKATSQAAAVPRKVTPTSVAMNTNNGQNVSLAPTKAPFLPSFLKTLPTSQDPGAAARAQYAHAPIDTVVKDSARPELGDAQAGASPTTAPTVEKPQSPNSHKSVETLLPAALEAEPTVNKKDPFARSRKIRV